MHPPQELICLSVPKTKPVFPLCGEKAWNETVPSALPPLTQSPRRMLVWKILKTFEEWKMYRLNPSGIPGIPKPGVGSRESPPLPLCSSSAVRIAMNGKKPFILQMPGASAASPPVFSLWHLRHFPAVYCSTNTPVLLHFMDFYPAEDIRERSRAVSCKDFSLSSLHVSSLLLTTAAEHFPAEHEAMRLMSPICDSLSHPLPGGQCCLCLHGLKVLSEGWCLGCQVLYPAPLLSACRAEDPLERPVLGVMLAECAVALGLLGMPSSWNRGDWNGQRAVFSPAFAASGSGPILRPFNTCFLAFPSLLGKIRSATHCVCLIQLWSFSELLKKREGPCIS